MPILHKKKKIFCIISSPCAKRGKHITGLVQKPKCPSCGGEACSIPHPIVTPQYHAEAQQLGISPSNTYGACGARRHGLIWYDLPYCYVQDMRLLAFGARPFGELALDDMGFWGAPLPQGTLSSTVDDLHGVPLEGMNGDVVILRRLIFNY